MVEFKIASQNVRGLNNLSKRVAIFNWFKNKNFDIIFLQETFSSNHDEQLWQSEWEGPIYFSHGSKHSCGIAILIRKTFDFKALEIHKDCNGRYIFIKAEIQDEIIYLLNVYAPNTEKDKHTFFRCLHDKIKEANISINDVIFMGGDWNSIMSGNLDKSGGKEITGDTVTNEMKTILIDLDLIDIWRLRNPSVKRFTYRQKRPLIQTRLDYFLISRYATDMVNQAQILASYCSDHSCVCLSLSTMPNNSRGNGFWKYNASLNDDEMYVGSMNRLLQEWYIQYDEIQDKNLKWDIIKYEIQKFTVKYAARKKKDINQELNLLNKELNNLEQELGERPSEEMQNKYESKRVRLSEIENEIAKGAIIRSRIKWLEEGEQGTKYFYDLEKSNYSKKHIRKLISAK